MSSAANDGQDQYCPKALIDTEDRNGTIQPGDWQHIVGTENPNPLCKQSCNRSLHVAIKVREHMTNIEEQIAVFQINCAFL